jgi:hypothetical protein
VRDANRSLVINRLQENWLEIAPTTQESMENPPTKQPSSLFAWLRRNSMGRHSARLRHHSFLEGVLGTSLELQVASASPQLGPQVEAELLGEIDRLEAIFSVYNPNSEFNRWQETFEQDVPVSPELAQVLARSEMWRVRSENAFNPAVEAMTHLWKIGAQTETVPAREELERLSHEIQAPLWNVDTDACRARRLTTNRASLNSIAKYRRRYEARGAERGHGRNRQPVHARRQRAARRQGAPAQRERGHKRAGEARLSNWRALVFARSRPAHRLAGGANRQRFGAGRRRPDRRRSGNRVQRGAAGRGAATRRLAARNRRLFAKRERSNRVQRVLAHSGRLN